MYKGSGAAAFSAPVQPKCVVAIIEAIQSLEDALVITTPAQCILQARPPHIQSGSVLLWPVLM